MKYLIKENYDESGVLIEYTIAGKTNATHRPRNGKFFFVQADDGIKHPVIDITDGEVTVIEDTDKKDIADGLKVMQDGIKADAVEMFGAVDDKERQFLINSYLTRIAAPTPYAGEGLKAHIVSDSFLKGAALDTPQKIKDYYSELLVNLDNKRRAKRVIFEALKASKGK